MFDLHFFATDWQFCGGVEIFPNVFPQRTSSSTFLSFLSPDEPNLRLYFIYGISFSARYWNNICKYF